MRLETIAAVARICFHSINSLGRNSSLAQVVGRDDEIDARRSNVSRGVY
jgi:hypothetical protein